MIGDAYTTEGVYPRACGGTSRNGVCPQCGGGLSPRMRGNQSSELGGVASTGSIPAHAGEPPNPNGRSPAARVYPRACGGTDVKWNEGILARGLSPRMRGNPSRSADVLAEAGSIPAHAGEPPEGQRPRRRDKVYPRACGGTWVQLTGLKRHGGLSPRMRGNRFSE